MRRFSIFILLIWMAAGAYFFVGPGKAQVKSLRQMAMLEMGIWKPDPPARTSGCRSNGSMPDPACTPGATVPSDRSLLCLPKELASEVPQAKITRGDWGRTLAAYGIERPRRLEPNLLVPASLAGRAEQSNLWPIKRKLAPQKRRIEKQLLRQVCDGKISLARAQKQIAEDWPRAAS